MRIAVFILVTVIVAGIMAIGMRSQRKARRDAEGWNVLYPGWFLHALNIVLAGIGLYWTWSMLSSPNPFGEGAGLGWGIAILFIGAALGMSWFCYGRTLRWQENRLQVSTVFGTRREVLLSDVRSVLGGARTGEYRLVFHNGRKLSMPAYLNGTGELMTWLAQRIGVTDFRTR